MGPVVLSKRSDHDRYFGEFIRFRSTVPQVWEMLLYLRPNKFIGHEGFEIFWCVENNVLFGVLPA